MTQCQMILEYLKSNDGITSLEAYQKFGCMRLGAKIKDLEASGYRFNRYPETGENRFGAKTNYVRYKLVSEEPAHA